MSDSGNACDAEHCFRRATQVGVVPLPIQSLELRLCDDHVAALRAGKLQGLSQEPKRRGGGYTRPQVTFAE
jgi:hypothetical protein